MNDEMSPRMEDGDGRVVPVEERLNHDAPLLLASPKVRKRPVEGVFTLIGSRIRFTLWPSCDDVPVIFQLA
ncbi:MAG: hypothetical protein KF812_12840 [Fimbriimonadaceae bacterium]|nr:hypothetical protein [Fimbriimonadaceae bacterium]